MDVVEMEVDSSESETTKTNTPSRSLWITWTSSFWHVEDGLPSIPSVKKSFFFFVFLLF